MREEQLCRARYKPLEIDDGDCNINAKITSDGSGSDKKLDKFANV